MFQIYFRVHGDPLMFDFTGSNLWTQPIPNSIFKSEKEKENLEKNKSINKMLTLTPMINIGIVGNVNKSILLCSQVC